MNRLTTLGPDGRPMLAAGADMLQAVERLYQFEAAMDDKVIRSLRILHGYCKGADFRGEAEALDKILALTEKC